MPDPCAHSTVEYKKRTATSVDTALWLVYNVSMRAVNTPTVAEPMMERSSTAMADASNPSARANKCVKRNPTASLSSDSCCNVFRSDSSA